MHLNTWRESELSLRSTWVLLGQHIEEPILEVQVHSYPTETVEVLFRAAPVISFLSLMKFVLEFEAPME